MVDHAIRTTGVFDKIMKEKLRPEHRFYWGLDEKWHIVPTHEMEVLRGRWLELRPIPGCRVLIWVKPEAPDTVYPFKAGVDQVVDTRYLVVDVLPVEGVDADAAWAV